MTLSLRRCLTAEDPQIIQTLVEDTGFFRPDEVLIAVDLVRKTLEKQDEYSFLLAEDREETIGYVCYSEIPGTSGSYEIYWAAVLKKLQQMGIGRALLAAAENDIKNCGGRRIYISTSGIELYAPTRKFYTKCGYEIAATLKDFYRPGDDQVIFLKVF